MLWQNLPAPFSGQKVIVAISKKKQYVIVEDEGKYTASYRKLGGSTTVHIIDYDNRVQSLEEAKRACEETDKIKEV